MAENIHKIMNHFDEIFGRKRISLRISNIDGIHVYLRAIYEKNVLITEDCLWKGYEMSVKPGDKADLGITIALWLHDENEDKKEPWETDRHYKLKLWKDNIYVNAYVMPDRRMAQEFYEARNKWAGCLANLIAGGYDVELGTTLEKQLKECCKKELHATANDICRLMEGKSPYHWYDGKTKHDRFKSIQHKMQSLMRTYEYTNFQIPENDKKKEHKP